MNKVKFGDICKEYFIILFSTLVLEYCVKKIIFRKTSTMPLTLVACQSIFRNIIHGSHKIMCCDMLIIENDLRLCEALNNVFL